MKTELKTLKDIEKDFWGDYCENSIDAFSLIKQEAIKWVKAEYWEDWDESCHATDWIKKFFNIQEEDLK